MARSFGIVEEKLREAEFFLDALGNSSRMSPGARFYFSAFISSARSVTYALQACMSGVPGFSDWYRTAQQALRTDRLAPLFLELRNEAVHVGVNRLNQVGLEHLKQHLADQMSASRHMHTLIIPDPERLDATLIADAVQISTTYFSSLARTVFDCYSVFKAIVDPRWYFTGEHFAEMGKTFEDALAELGFPRSWADDVPLGPDPWRVLRRQQPPCQINDVFLKYLGQEIPDSDPG